MLSGLITCTFNGKRHIATLPSGHRPEKILTFSINAHAEAARIEVRPNGKVWWITGGGKRHGWVSLDGIAFTLPGTKEVGLPVDGELQTLSQQKLQRADHRVSRTAWYASAVW